MRSVLACLPGPLAQNMDLLRGLVDQALERHARWRLERHPQDLDSFPGPLPDGPERSALAHSLRSGLARVLDLAAQGAPFFSPRHLGHMNPDLLIPALAGYMGAMLFNRNSVSGDSSPGLARLEHEAVSLLLDMAGMDPGRGWGCLTSGGTSSNILGLYTARSLRCLPFSLRQAMAVDPACRPLREGLTARTARGEDKPLSGMTPRELANIPARELCGLRRNGIALLEAKAGLEPHGAGTLWEGLVRPWSVATLGLAGFGRMVGELFGPQWAALVSAPRVYAASNAHYSWPKACDVLGLGRDALAPTPLLPSLDLDVEALAQMVRRDAEAPGQWPLCVVATLGSTGQGSLDDLPAILQVVHALEQELGVTPWVHADACHGGYLASMLRPGQGEPDKDLRSWITDCAARAGAEPDEARLLSGLSETGQAGWLCWDEFEARLGSMAQADSLSIDPHKLGCVPLACGALLLRDRRAAQPLADGAPYLWNGSDHEPGQDTGRYTLEGSRPGAAAAACWLAHATVPLDRAGHGLLMALSLLSTRKLFLALRDAGGEQSGLTLPHAPHSNILCYAPWHRDVGHKLAGKLRGLVLEGLRQDDPSSPFQAVAAEVPLPGQDTPVGVPAIRSVAMTPYGLTAQLRPEPGQAPIPLYQAYARHLLGLIDQAARELA